MKTSVLKTIKLLVPLLISSFLVVPAIAAEIEEYSSWAQIGDGSSWIKYSSDYVDESKALEARIGHSTSGGHQILYFSDYYVEDYNTCDYETDEPNNITMVFNGQAVKMLQWCQKFTDAEQYYLTMSPETERGESYIINLFKVATLPIKIQYNNETLYFPVIGFTKAWNSAGGDAI